MKINHLLAILLFVLLVISPVKVVSNFISFQEAQNGNPHVPHVIDIQTYDDDTMVIRIIRSISFDGFYTYLEQNLSFRTIYPNGIIIPVDISMEKLDIQPLNFCNFNTPDGRVHSPIKLYAVKSNLLLMTYVVAGNISDFSTYQKWTMLVDLSGNIQNSSRTYLGPYIDTRSNLPFDSYIKINVDRSKGFLYVDLIPDIIDNAISARMMQYKVADDGMSIIQLSMGSALNLTNNNYIEVTAMINGGYALIFANYTGSVNSSDPLSLNPQGGIYAIFINYGELPTREPSILFQTESPLNFTALYCGINYSGVGQTCLLTVKPNIVNPNLSQENFYIEVNFLSEGSVFQVNAITTNSLATQYSYNMDYHITPLPFGGQLIRGELPPTANGTTIYGFIVLENSTFIPWNLPNPVLIDVFSDVFAVLSNNTLVLPQPAIDTTWTLFTTNLYKVAGDSEFDNIVINSTFPDIGDKVYANGNPFTIIYNQPVGLSNGSITIFRVNGSVPNPQTDNIRQIINPTEPSNANYIQTIGNNTVSVTIINSTFNLPGTYYALIDNNFVKSLAYGEPLYGLKKPIWYFTLNEEKIEFTEKALRIVNFDKVDGTVRLNPIGTKYFEGLNYDEKKEFVKNLTNNIADTIPINRERITTSSRYQNDITISSKYPKQILLSINIDKAKNLKQRPSNSIAYDLDALIHNLPITVLASGEFSTYLDEHYGYVSFPSWLEENKSKFTVTFIGFFLMIILFAISICRDDNNDNNSEDEDTEKHNKDKNKNEWKIIKIKDIIIVKIKKKIRKIETKLMIRKMKKHFAIISIGLIIINFVTEIFFTATEAASIDNIFVTSVFFIVFPFVVNLAFMIRIALHEVKDESNEVTDVLLEETVPASPSLCEEANELEINNEGGQGQIKSLKDLYAYHPNIFVIFVILAGFDDSFFELLGPNKIILGKNYKIKLDKESKFWMYWAGFFNFLLKEFADIIIKSFFLSSSIRISYVALLKLILNLSIFKSIYCLIDEFGEAVQWILQ